jgi:hypothetical protein
MNSNFGIKGYLVSQKEQEEKSSQREAVADCLQWEGKGRSKMTQKLLLAIFLILSTYNQMTWNAHRIKHQGIKLWVSARGNTCLDPKVGAENTEDKYCDGKDISYDHVHVFVGVCWMSTSHVRDQDKKNLMGSWCWCWILPHIDWNCLIMVTLTGVANSHCPYRSISTKLPVLRYIVTGESQGRNIVKP